MRSDELEVALLSLPLIEDCAVLDLAAPSGPLLRIAYVVLRGSLTRQKIESHVTEVAPEVRRPDHVVFVNRLPRAGDGTLDVEALRRVPVVDDALARSLEAALSEDSRFAGAAVVVEEAALTAALVHERQVLPPSFATPGASVPAPAVLRVDGAPRADVPAEARGAELAECDGPPLSAAAAATLPDALRAAAASFDDARITYLGANQSVRRDTFAALLSEARRVHGGLVERGLSRGDKVVLQLDRPEDVLPAFWGCLLGGIVPVIAAVPPSYESGTNDVERLVQVIRLLGEPWVLAAASSNVELRRMLEQAGLAGDRVAGLDELRSANAMPDAQDLDPGAPAFFTLTSGSTGTPKAVMLSHSSVIARARGTNRLCNHEENDRVLNWLPFDHIGSISDWHLRCVILGCHMVYCTKEYVLGDPLNWLRLIDRFRISHSWAPNFAYALVHDAARRAPGGERWDLSCLRTLLTAGEAVSSSTVRDFLGALEPHGMAPTVVRPAFGMAELGSGVTYYVPTPEHPVRVAHVDRARLDGRLTRVEGSDPRAVAFTCLGPVIPSARMRIVDDEGRVLPEDHVGRLQIGGDPVCLGYFENPEANREVFAGGGWFNTGDRAFVSGKELYLTGRDKESLVINGANFHNGEIEAVVSAVPGVRVSFTAACAVRDESEGERLAVFFCTDVLEEELGALLTEIQKQITSKIGIKADYLLPVSEHCIPKTAIGKIQRKALTRRFEAGEFESLVRRMDLMQQNERTLPDWFLEPVFVAKALARRGPTALRGVLLIEGEPARSSALRRALYEVGVPWTSVPAGAALPAVDHPLSHVIDLTDHAGAGAPSSDAKAPVQRLTGLARAVRESAALAGAGTVRFVAVASHAQAAGAGDVVDAARAAVPVALMTLGQELGNVECRHVDVPAAQGTSELDDLARLLLSECTAAGREAEVAYRGGVRLARAFRRVAWPESGAPAARLERGALYLITGGLGGVGAELSRYLLERWGARLIVVGRSPAHGPAARPERRAVLADLQRRGSVDYEVADVTDARALAQAVQRAEARAGQPVRGAFHLASGYHESRLDDETHASLEAVLSPKVLGAAAVHAAVGEGAFVACFTSLAAVNGGASVGAYAAANRLVDSLCHAERRRGRASYSISWSVWKGLGIGAESAPASVLRSRGYHAITPAKGLTSLAALLGLPPAHYAVGADAAHPSVASRVEGPVEPLWSLSAMVVPRGAGLPAEMPVPFDVLGNPARPSVRRFRGAPAGVDREVLVAALKAGGRGTRRLATTDAERRLAAIWQEVLGVDEVGVGESFFDIGGTSLLSLRLFSEMERVFGVTLPLSTLYRASTIETLAALVEAEDAPRSIRLLSASAGKSTSADLTLHLLHDTEGQTDVYRALAKRLEGRVRVYAVAPRSDGAFPVLFTRIDDMAEHAALRIRKAQPHGPYAVGGHGIGGALAHAVACRLQKAGEVVTTVVLLDAMDTACKPVRAAGKSGIFRKVDGGLRERLFSAGAKRSTSLARTGIDYARLTLLRRCLDRGERPPWYLEHLSLEAVYRFAAQDYAPPTFSGPMVLFRARDAHEDGSEPDLGWRGRATLGTRVVEVPGEHRTMLDEPHVALLAGHLERTLADALAGSSATKRSA